MISQDFIAKGWDLQGNELDMTVECVNRVYVLFLVFLDPNVG